MPATDAFHEDPDTAPVPRDEGALLGGSLDGDGSAENGYSLRGARMLE